MLRGFVSPELFAFQASGNAVIMVILGTKSFVENYASYLQASGNAVIMVILGGSGTLAGALYGAAILTVFKSLIGTWSEHHLIIIGALFMLSVIFLPKGLAGYVLPRIQRRLARRGGGQ